MSLETALEAFLRALEGKNRGAATLRAYSTDVSQFIDWIHENNLVTTTPAQVRPTSLAEGWLRSWPEATFHSKLPVLPSSTKME